MEISNLPPKSLAVARAIAGDFSLPLMLDRVRYLWHAEHVAHQHPEDDTETLVGRAVGRLLNESRPHPRTGATVTTEDVTLEAPALSDGEALRGCLAWLRGIAVILLLILAALALLAARAHAQLDGLRIYDEASLVRQISGGFAAINCTGSGISCVWNSSTRRVDVTVSAVGGGTITIREQDGAPSVSADTLEFDQAVGFVGSNPIAGTFRVTLSNVPQSVIQNLTSDLAAKQAISEKNQASGYAGLTAGSKLQTAQGQEVWSIVDLSDVDALTGLSVNDVLYYTGTTWTRRASAPKADALTADPNDCVANQYANAIAANGNLSCAQVGFSQVSGTVSNAQIANGAVDSSKISDGSVAVSDVAAILKTRSITYLVGSETGSALADTDDQPSIWVNRLGQGIHITEIWCEADAGSPVINLQKDDGTPSNILSSNLTCSTSGASSNSFTVGEDAVANGDRLDHVTVTAGATAKRITVNVKYTLD